MIVNERDENGGLVVFRWELLEEEFKRLLVKSDRNIKDVDKWWKKNKDDVLYRFHKGFEVFLEGYEDIMDEAIDNVLNTDEDELLDMVQNKVNQGE
jgi:hypothetical protein